MKILVVDVGGNNVKVLVTGRRKPIKIPSGPRLTPQVMTRKVREATADWKYDVVTIGYPGPVARGRIVGEPVNIGKGWVGFDFRKAFRRPVRVINDAAMQALGSYRGRNMLFLGLGTGLGTAMVRDGALVPMEMGHLPYRDGYEYEEFVGEAGMKRLGKAAWRRHVAKVTALFVAALEVDYVVYGGGNSKHLNGLPPGTRLGKNANAFKGGFLLWRRAAQEPSRGRRARRRRR